MDTNMISSDDYNAALNNVLNSCPEFDLKGLVKKTDVQSVCYGCDSPN